MFKSLQALAALMVVTASPATAQVINFTNPTTITTSSFTPSGSGVTVTGYTFGNAATSTLDGALLSSLTGNQTLAVSNRGIGVCTEGGSASGSSGECPQVDTNNSPNEALYLNFTGSTTTNILQAVLNIVDGDDTLAIFGVGAGGALDLLGFSGSIISGGSGTSGLFTSVPYMSDSSSGPQYLLTFNPAISGFSGYLFASNNNTADGYRLRSLTIAAVPEPEVWAMMLLGFGAIGFQMRRRGGLRTVTA